MTRWIAALCLVLTPGLSTALAQEAVHEAAIDAAGPDASPDAEDEPGLAPDAQDEPGTSREAAAMPGERSSDVPTSIAQPEAAVKASTAPASSPWKLWFELDIGFGYSSLLEDPDVAEGYGGGLDFTVGFHRRVGVQLSFFFSNNDYEDQLGEIGSRFLLGSLYVGPVVLLLPPEWRVQLAAGAGVGAYVVMVSPGLQDEDWTLGVGGGAAFSVRATRWLSVGVKLRYHLYNLAGGDSRDIKTFNRIGVMDRLDLPLFVAFVF